MMNRNSSTLIQRMLQGDESSFNDIIAWYAEDVLRLSYLLLGNSEEAKDVLQECMIRLVGQVKQGKFRSVNGSIKGFLLTTARNLCLNKLRGKQEIHSIEQSGHTVDRFHPERRTPGLVLDAREFETAFDRALEQLSTQQRTVFVLHELQGESYQDLAGSLNLTVECVRTHLYQARKKLRQIMTPYLGEL